MLEIHLELLDVHRSSDRGDVRHEVSVQLVAVDIGAHVAVLPANFL